MLGSNLLLLEQPLGSPLLWSSRQQLRSPCPLAAQFLLRPSAVWFWISTWRKSWLARCCCLCFEWRTRERLLSLCRMSYLHHWLRQDSDKRSRSMLPDRWQQLALWQLCTASSWRDSVNIHCKNLSVTCNKYLLADQVRMLRILRRLYHDWSDDVTRCCSLTTTVAWFCTRAMSQQHVPSRGSTTLALCSERVNHVDVTYPWLSSSNIWHIISKETFANFQKPLWDCDFIFFRWRCPVLVQGWILTNTLPSFPEPQDAVNIACFLIKMLEQHSTRVRYSKLWSHWQIWPSAWHDDPRAQWLHASSWYSCSA